MSAGSSERWEQGSRWLVASEEQRLQGARSKVCGCSEGLSLRVVTEPRAPKLVQNLDDSAGDRLDARLVPLHLFGAQLLDAEHALHGRLAGFVQLRVRGGCAGWDGGWGWDRIGACACACACA